MKLNLSREVGKLFFKTAYLEVEVKGESKERFLNLCAHHEINLWDIAVKENSFIVHINLQDFFSLKKIVKKTNTRIRIRKKSGIIFIVRNLLGQKIFYCFFLLGMAFLFLFSRYLWRIEFIGNQTISTILLKEFLLKQEIMCGMLLNEIKTEELEKEIRKEFFEITWVSVSIEGTTLKVELKENDTLAEESNEIYRSDIISNVSGTVESIFVRQGTPIVKKGDKVKKGDILISGEIPIPLEDGSIKRIQENEAKGDVWISYDIPIHETLLLEYDSKVFSGKEKVSYELQFYNRLLSSWIKNKKFVCYDTIVEEITPNFIKNIFPDIKFIRKTYRDYLPVKEKYNENEGIEILTEQFNKILKSLNEKGVQIIEKNVKISTDNVSVSLRGKVMVKELFRENDVYNE